MTGIAAALAMTAVTLSTHAAVTATQGLGGSWVGTPSIVTSDPPTVFTIPETSYVANSQTNLAQSFTVTNAQSLTNIQIYISGAAVSNTIHLFDLGLANAGNPASFTPGSAPTSADLFSAGLGFQYNGGGANVLRLQFSGADAVALTAGHEYAFEIDPQADGQMAWYRSTSDVYVAGEAYRGRSLLNAGGRDLALAVTFASAPPPPPPPSTNFSVTVSSYPMTNAWPGSPMIQTFADPSVPDDLNSAGTGVPEGFGPASDATGPGRAIGQTFVQTNKSFRLGAVSIKMRGNGGTTNNVIYFLSMYWLTNNAFVNTNATLQQNRYPFNYQPSQDSAPAGVSLFGTNLVGCYITTSSILPGVAAGLSNQLLTFTFTDPQAQVVLPSCGTLVNAGTNAIYTFEITIGTNQMLPPGGLNSPDRGGPLWTGDTALDGVFQWIRGISVNSTFEKACYTDPILGGAGAGRFRNPGGSFAASPRAYSSSSYTNFNGDVDMSPSDPRCVRGLISGDIRDMVMAVYAAPPSITSGAYLGHNFVLTLQPSIDGTTFTVQKKTNLLDAAWTTLTAGYPVGGVPISSSITYTDITAGASSGFYRITSP